ncbi:MAG: hypothetical protein IBX61_02190 [Thermoleophilia bacterium]|nr:hypothetical protein [Thermoleophilia bacterium]
MLNESLNDTMSMEGIKEAFIAQSMDDPNRFFTCSRWESLAAYDEVQLDFAGRHESLGLTDLLTGPPLWGSYMIIG